MYFSTIIIRDLIAYAIEKGAEVKELEKELLPYERQKYIGYETIVKLLNHLGQELNDEYLGLHIGEQSSLKVTVDVDSIMLNSKSLEDSIQNAVEYSKLISDALVCSFQKGEQFFSVIYEENPNWKVHQSYAKRQVMDITLLSNVKSLIAYTNFPYFPVKINLSYERPQNLVEYYRLFNCSLYFNQPHTEIIYDRQIMDRHTKKVTYGLLENLKDRVADEIQNLPEEDDFIFQLKKCILNSKPQRILLEDASRKLKVSKRTLQRKLKNANTTFKKIESGLQLKLAKTYLEENQKSLDEISYLLGFSESSAFIRFFRSLTTLTPMEYQRKVK